LTVPDRSNFRSTLEPSQGDNVVVGGSQRVTRLSLTPQERANLPVDTLGLLSPMMLRDPATWELGEVQAVLASLDRANGNEAAHAVGHRLMTMRGEQAIRDHERAYQPLLHELRRINDELVDARRRPVSRTYSERVARMRVDREKREAGVAAMEQEREVWRANLGDPQAATAVQAARARAEARVEQRRPDLEHQQTATVESERTRASNDRHRELMDRKAAIRRQLASAGVRVPEDPRELRA
jgi:hypothetical protein